eukprot:TRINITY_DN44791_c0_g1_i1.p1 TRINITY_DN44791_c0_g1~~TRINITY_DN44791_c0_g1_i1.p1  ORF type:complete len:420 (-),score=15.77 TRINITY_DN44791_c0_g1_i1:147-1358(-)
MDDLVSFEVMPTSSGSAVWEARVREAANQISVAANKHAPSISEIVGKASGGRIENEVVTLRRKIEQLQAARFKADPAVETIQSLILGKPYSLEHYKSLKQKEDLLDCALEMGDGDAILAVTIMIKRTLKHQKFLSLICTRPIAAETLVNYMITRHELSQVNDLLNALGRFHDSGIVSFRQAISAKNLEGKIRNLKQLLHTQMSGHADAGIVLEQINLLERVSPILESETRYPDRQLSGLSSSVLQALTYFTQYYHGAPENLLHSPEALRKMHKLSEKQYLWVSVRGRATAEAWKDCENLLVGKGWLGGVKAKGGINMIEMATVLHDAKCPVETLSVILQAVESPADRLETAKKLKVASVVVDVLLAQKDRNGLTRYRDSLVLNSRDWFYAENALTTSNVKWKN